MPLGRQVVPIAFREGLDTKTSAVNSIPGRLLELQNGVFGKVGEISKRNGYDLLSRNLENGLAITAADALATYQDELLLFGSGRVYSYSPELTTWLDRGAAVSVKVDERPVVRNTYAQSVPDVAQIDGLTCVVWEDTRGGVRYSVTDTATGTAFVADGSLSLSGTRPMVVPFDGAFVVFYALGNNIFYRRVVATAPTSLTVEANPISTLDPSTLAYDVALIDSKIYIAFDTTTDTQIAYLDTALTLSVVVTGLAASTHVALFADAEPRVWLLRSNATTQTIQVFNGAGSSLVGPVTIGSETSVASLAGIIQAGSTTARVFLSLAGSISGEDVVITCTVDGAGTATALAAISYSVSLAGRPFEHGGAVYVPTLHDSAYQATAYVMDVSGNVIAKGSPGVGGGRRSRKTLSHASSVTAGTYLVASTVKTALESSTAGLFSRNGVGLMSVDFAATNRFAAAELGNVLLVSGGALQAYDGATLGENGFHVYPEGATATTAAGGGGLTIGLTYRWKVIYERTDAHGQIHRSGVGTVLGGSLDYYTSVAGSETVTIEVPTLRITSYDGVRIVVYRTEGNGSIYYRLTPIATPTLNDKTADSVTFVDTYADSAIVSNELLYTDGAAGSPLENIAPGASSAIATHQGRAFLVAGKNRIVFSQQVDEGEAPAFHDALYLIPDARGGDIVAVASLDDKLVILKDSALYYTAGAGPDDNGAGEYPKPALITSDVGCSDARSVVATTAGIMFRSAKGIYILDRSLQVTYIGAPVEDYNGLTITSATLVPAKNQVRFTTSGVVVVGTESYSNIALVYDYVFNQWATFTNCGGLDSLIWDGDYTYCRSDGKVLTESATSYSDAGQFVKLKLTTSWLSFAGVQGYQRIYRVLALGDYKSAHSMRIRLGYDFRPEFTYDQTLNAETIVAPGTWGSGTTWGLGALWGGNASVEWFTARPERQKCSAIRVSIEDVQNGSTVGESFSISNLALLVGVKRGAQKMPAVRQT